VLDVLSKVGMLRRKVADIPMGPNLKLLPGQEKLLEDQGTGD